MAEKQKLPPTPQEWYDDNRARLDGETTIAENVLPGKCDHNFKRVSATEIQCQQCRLGLIDMGKFKLVNGKITRLQENLTTSPKSQLN